MKAGEINTDYIMFVLNDDPEIIKEMVQDLAYSIKLEYDLRNMELEEAWDF